jgi:hypothetical protein
MKKLKNYLAWRAKNVESSHRKTSEDWHVLTHAAFAVWYAALGYVAFIAVTTMTLGMRVIVSARM